MANDTRQRIMEAARRLFNEQRFGNVTTAALAAEVGIAEGNLWYHFKNKRMLLEALTEEFITHVEPRLAILPKAEGNNVQGQFSFLLLECAHEIREFRFLYRDQADYGEHTDVLLEHLPDIFTRTINQFEQFFHEMIKIGDLKWPAGKVHDLATNVVIILRFHLEYLREIQADESAGSGAVHSSLLQQLTLYETQMKPDAAARLREYLLPDQTGETVAQAG